MKRSRPLDSPRAVVVHVCAGCGNRWGTYGGPPRGWIVDGKRVWCGRRYTKRTPTGRVTSVCRPDGRIR